LQADIAAPTARTGTARADAGATAADVHTRSAQHGERLRISGERDHAPRVALDQHRLLGRSGLRVSPIALGTMTFGADWGWGAERKEARRMFDAYLDRGGNFIDTANTYTDGSAERLLGEFAAGRRDRLVIATKCAGATIGDDPNSGGNHRKGVLQSVERSLRALQSDYVDLLYLHLWDGDAAIEEILRTLDDLVSSGKVLCVGVCGTPAWQIARMQAIAELRGWAQPVAVQSEYSLIERSADRELIPMARELDMAMMSCSPLAGGVLTGKYSEHDLVPGAAADVDGTRQSLAAASGALGERGLTLARVVREIAAELDTSAARVALAWTLINPGVTAPIVGARTQAQLEDNLGALELELSATYSERLDSASVRGPTRPRDLLAGRSLVAASGRAGRPGARPISR
jgi:aryl-alcohol dehydrogenase-like predicted oxidoreductase